MGVYTDDEKRWSFSLSSKIRPRNKVVITRQISLFFSELYDARCSLDSVFHHLRKLLILRGREEGLSVL